MVVMKCTICPFIPHLTMRRWVIYIFSVFRSKSFNGCYKGDFKVACVFKSIDSGSQPGSEWVDG